MTCKIIDLPKIMDVRGNLTFIEGRNQIPFEIKRVFYLYDVPGGGRRGGHANIKAEQFVIAASGSFDIVVSYGDKSQKFSLNRSYFGLYIPNMVWREIENFSSGAVCLVLTSEPYTADDYIRSWDEYVEMKKGEQIDKVQ